MPAIAGAPGEAVFVPAGSSADEPPAGTCPTSTTRCATAADLVIVDASDFTGKPVARVHLPQRVPHGFHGNWITD